MNPEIQNLINKEIKKSLNNFNVPFHIHNGIDAPYLSLQGLSNINVNSATYNPPSLADGAGTTTSVTVTGALLGDFALASFSLDLQGILMTAYVSTNDTVSIRLQNETGGVLDLASGTLTALTIRN